MVLMFLRGCDEAGAGSAGMDCRPGKRSKSLPSPASGGSPSSTSYRQSPLAAGRKKKSWLAGPQPQRHEVE